jgi:hypothetical protein
MVAAAARSGRWMAGMRAGGEAGGGVGNLNCGVESPVPVTATVATEWRPGWRHLVIRSSRATIFARPAGAVNQPESDSAPGRCPISQPGSLEDR